MRSPNRAYRRAGVIHTAHHTAMVGMAIASDHAARFFTTPVATSAYAIEYTMARPAILSRSAVMSLGAHLRARSAYHPATRAASALMMATISAIEAAMSPGEHGPRIRAYHAIHDEPCLGLYISHSCIGDRPEVCIDLEIFPAWAGL